MRSSRSSLGFDFVVRVVTLFLLSPNTHKIKNMNKAFIVVHGDVQRVEEIAMEFVSSRSSEVYSLAVVPAALLRWIAENVRWSSKREHRVDADAHVPESVVVGTLGDRKVLCGPTAPCAYLGRPGQRFLFLKDVRTYRENGKLETFARIPIGTQALCRLIQLTEQWALGENDACLMVVQAPRHEHHRHYFSLGFLGARSEAEDLGDDVARQMRRDLGMITPVEIRAGTSFKREKFRYDKGMIEPHDKHLVTPFYVSV